MATKPADKKKRSAKSSETWKGKTPGQRRRENKKAGDDGPGVGFTTVSVKMRREEKAELKRVCKSLGITPNRAMRVMARKASGFLEIDDAVLKEMMTIRRQLTGVARNINQIAKAGNRTHSPDFRAFMEDRAELGRELTPLLTLLMGMANIATRRSDGKTKLKEAAESS